MKLAIAILFAVVAGCQKPLPPPHTGPDAADASPAPSHATCAAACLHAEKVCPGAGVVCNATCPGNQTWDPGYAPCVMKATGCFNCDIMAR